MNELPNVDWYDRPVREGEKWGYAPGDRIVVVAGSYEGEIGHVAFMGGCRSSCAYNCRVVYVRHGNEKPKFSGQPPWDRSYRVDDVTHID